MKTVLPQPAKLAGLDNPNRFRSRRRIMLAIIMVALLPAVAFGSGAAAYHQCIAQAPVPGGAVVDFLGDKSLTYWFLTLAAIAIASWTWILKWLIGQLESQRTAHSLTQDKLLDYMGKDRVQILQSINDNAETTKKLVSVLEANVIKADNRHRDL